MDIKDKVRNMTEKDAELVMIALCSEEAWDVDVPTLKDVHDTFKKWLYIEETDTLDIILATALSRKMEGKPLWTIIVAPSGDGKTELLAPLDDNGTTVKTIHRFTDKTLVNGYQKKEKHPDLAPKLDGKIMLILDMAEILQLNPVIKGEVWGQLRNLYDGYAGVNTGEGTDIRYTGLRVTFLAASTPAIDDQILIHQSLGTREMIYRPEPIKDRNALLKKVWENVKFDNIYQKELRSVMQKFVKKTPIMDIQPSEEIFRKLRVLAEFLAYMRASASTDYYSGELRSAVTPEMPTRILHQLCKYYIALKSLDMEYPDTKAMKIITQLVFSSINWTRFDVLSILFDGQKHTTNDIREKTKLGRKAIKGELETLWNMGIIDREAVMQTNNYGYEYVLQEDWLLRPKTPVLSLLSMLSSAEYMVSNKYSIRIVYNKDIYGIDSLYKVLGNESTKDISENIDTPDKSNNDV